jgi:hypothetical protein
VPLHANLGWDYGFEIYILTILKCIFGITVKNYPINMESILNFIKYMGLFKTNYVPSDGRDIVGFEGEISFQKIL